MQGFLAQCDVVFVIQEISISAITHHALNINIIPSHITPLDQYFDRYLVNLVSITPQTVVLSFLLGLFSYYVYFDVQNTL